MWIHLAVGKAKEVGVGVGWLLGMFNNSQVGKRRKNEWKQEETRRNSKVSQLM